MAIHRSDTLKQTHEAYLYEFCYALCFYLIVVASTYVLESADAYLEAQAAAEIERRPYTQRTSCPQRLETSKDM